jgi:hypothetical protein
VDINVLMYVSSNVHHVLINVNTLAVINNVHKNVKMNVISANKHVTINVSILSVQRNVLRLVIRHHVINNVKRNYNVGINVVVSVVKSVHSYVEYVTTLITRKNLSSLRKRIQKIIYIFSCHVLICLKCTH